MITSKAVTKKSLFFQILSLMFIILFLIAAFFQGMKYQKSKFQKQSSYCYDKQIDEYLNMKKAYDQLVNTNKIIPEDAYTLIFPCDKNKCLFEHGNIIYGYGKITGYYGTKEKSAFGETKICDLFTITGGDENINANLKNLIKERNTVNELNDKEQVVINIKLDDLSQNQINLVKSSNILNQTELSVIRRKDKATEVPACGSFFDIIGMQRAGQ